MPHSEKVSSKARLILLPETSWSMRIKQVKESGGFTNVSNTAILNRLIQLNFIEHIPYQGSTEKPNFTRRNLRIGYASTLIKKAIARIAMAIREK